MKKLICIAVLLGITSLLFAQREFAQVADEDSPLESLVGAERAFAKMSEQEGTRTAFMAFIADDGILLRPTAVRGRQWMTENPVPASDKRPWLSWEPIFADVARSGDLGYTTGPWKYKDDIHDSKPVAYGNFITVWKKQRGSWKFAIDLGTSNPAPNQPAKPLRLQKDRRAEPKGNPDNEAEADALLAREREFSSDSATRGAQKPFGSYATPQVRVFRKGKFPFVGAKVASSALPPGSSVWTWEPTFADVSESGDLGYSYGTYRLGSKASPSKTLEKGNYLRIWKKQGDLWKVVVDVADPLPLDEKK